jgi:hypothetical protein
LENRGRRGEEKRQRVLKIRGRNRELSRGGIEGKKGNFLGKGQSQKSREKSG